MIRNLKVRTKIVAIVLITAIISLAINAVRSYIQINDIFISSFQTGIDLGLKTSNETNSIMEKQELRKLQIIANQNANKINEQFIHISEKLFLISDIIEASYKSNSENKILPQKAVQNSVEYESAVSENSFAKYNLRSDVEFDAKIKQELLKISENNNLFSSILKNNNIIDNIYIGTESGIIFSFSKYKFLNAFDTRQTNWYKDAIESKGEIIWTDSYTEASGAISVNCSKTFFNPNGEIAGVISIRVKQVDIIENMLQNNNSIEGSSKFLLDNKRTFFGDSLILNESNVLHRALNETFLENSQNKIVNIKSVDYYLFMSKIEDNNWTFGFIVPVKNIFSSIEEVKMKIATQIEQVRQGDRTVSFETLSNVSTIFIFTTIISMLIAIFLSNYITKPLKKLMEQVHNIRKNGSKKIELTGKDEFADLSRAFNKMSDHLKNYIKELEYANVQKEYINGELEVARNIQLNLLPNLTDDFQDKTVVDFFARMTPAREIGGDFYDFFYTDSSKEKICFLVADVSGKGIPAAIYMSQGKMLVKTSILHIKNIVQALEDVNNTLSENNDSCMFITLLAISIDLTTKECVIVNCGHNNPIISLNGKPYEFFELKKATALGMSDKSCYEEQKLQLNSNDKICIYTDGIVEAMDENSDFFGKEMFLECANKNINLNPKNFDKAIRKELKKFTAGISQSDDITMLTIHIT